MSSALAPANFELDGYEPPPSGSPEGAQTLLALERAKPSYRAQGVALGLYALALVVAITYHAQPAPPVEEQALDLVMLPPATPEELPPPIEEPPPPVEEPTPPEAVEEPPPPITEEPVVAPVPPKPQSKPKPKVVEHKPPVEQPRRAAQPAAASPRTGPTNVPPNAIASGYANQVHARIARAAASAVPRAALARHETGRVGYRLVISPTGSLISQSISPSGNAAFDAAATQALARAAPFPATGMTRPAALSGAIVFR